MIPATSVEAAGISPSAQFVQEMLGLQFDSIEAKLQTLAGASELSDEIQFGHLCAALQADAAKNADYVSVLSTWRTHSPDSLWPDLVTCLVWEAAANRARGSDWLEATDEAQLQRAKLAQEALFLSASALLQRHPAVPWPLWMTLMRSVLGFNEPEWLELWIAGDQTPDWEAFKRRVEASWPNMPPIPSPDDRPPAALADTYFAVQRTDETPEALYWLGQTVARAPVGFYALSIFAHLRTPRWNGSREEILELADSAFASRLDEKQRNEIRLIAWLDAIDANSIDIEDTEELESAFALGAAILDHSFNDNGRALVHLKLAELAYMTDQSERACREFGKAVDANPNLRVSDQQIIWMLKVAEAHGMPTWLGQIASNMRQHSADGAVLFGLLCDTGWCSVEHAPAIAEEWYRHAASFGSLPKPEAVCPFNDVYYAFDEPVRASALSHMVRCGAELGFPEMQIAMAQDHSETDPIAAIHWYRLAAAQGSGRAMYNLSVICDEGVEQGGIGGMDATALRELGNDCEIGCLEQLTDKAELTEREENRIPNCFIGLKNFLADHQVDNARVRRNLSILRDYALMGWSEPMRILARHYQAEDCPQGQDYDRAVYWCEQALRLQPDDTDNVAIRRSLSEGILGKIRYRRSMAKEIQP